MPQLRENIFISYSHKDKRWMEKLQTMLVPLVRKEMIKVWADIQIESGAKWYEEIKKALDSAKVGVMLVTPNFLASDFIAKHELPALLKAAEKEGLIILWIAVSASMYKFTELAEYQAVNDPSNPLDSLSTSEQNRELVRICEKIKQAASIQQPELHSVSKPQTLHYSSVETDRTGIQQQMLSPQQNTDTLSLLAPSLEQLSGGSKETLPIHNRVQRLSQQDKRDLAQSLLACPCMNDRNARETVVRQLPQRLFRALMRSQRQDIDVTNIIDTCENYNGGLKSLIDIVRFYDEGTWQMQEVDILLQRVLPEILES